MWQSNKMNYYVFDRIRRWQFVATRARVYTRDASFLFLSPTFIGNQLFFNVLFCFFVF